jgi:4-amino-4-deoxy-L-arabinose transferase-like glycosyltransferase
MLEPDVALTDYLLAAEAALFVWLLWRPRVATAVRWPFAVFASTSVAALAGGTVHGFFPPGASGWARCCGAARCSR